jgi:hypothetical protein
MMTPAPPTRAAVVLHRRTPDRLPGGDIKGDSPAAVHHIHDAVVDGRLRKLAGVVAETGAPDRHQPLDVRLVDLAERTVLIEAVAHPEGGDVLAVLAVIDQLLRALRRRATAPRAEQRNQYLLHGFLLRHRDR